MSKIMYPITSVIIALSASTFIEGMNTKQNIQSTIEQRRMFKQVLNELPKDIYGFSEDIEVLDMQRNAMLEELIYDICKEKENAYKEKIYVYEQVLNEFHDKIHLYDRDYSLEEIAIIEKKRNHMLLQFLKNIYHEESKAKKAHDYAFAAVRNELLNKTIQTNPVELTQDEVFEQLAQSLIGMQNLQSADKIIQNQPEEQKEECTIVTEKTIIPVTVSRWTAFCDWWQGPQKIVNELTNDQLPLDVLKKSPDMQQRINNIITSCSPSKKRDSNMLPHLVNLYTQLKNLKFSFVDCDINTDIHNACLQWQNEEENTYLINRNARIMAIAQLLNDEMKKLHQEEAPRLMIIEQLTKIQELSQQTGIIQQNNDENVVKQENTTSSKVFNIVCHLEELCEELTKNDSK